jgi:hypothetical protein
MSKLTSVERMCHTPGPWHWDSDPVKGDPFNRVRYRVVATGKTITQCYYSSSDEHAEADARLIAAAPELLASLREVLGWYIEGGHAVPRIYIERANAAIAKVEGRS